MKKLLFLLLFISCYSFGQSVDGGLKTLIATGTANTYVISEALPATYNQKERFQIIFPATNTAASTINRFDLGIKDIRKNNGDALSANDIIAGSPYLIAYNSLNGYYVCETCPPGGGGTGTVTSVSVTTANGVSGSVATATTTPAISLTLGAITPTTVNGVTLSGSSTPTLAVTGTSTISGTHSGTSSGTNTGDQVSAALTKVDDTNVTLTLGGSPSTALLAASSITAGWTGTLASGRLNSNVVQGVTNDTNVTGSIAAQNLTLGWTGTLADSRITSSSNWNTAYTNRITSLTTTGNSGAATLISNTLNIPTYTLAGLGGSTYYAPTILVTNATDANFTAAANGIHNILDGIASTNRVITIPTGSNGDVIKIYNTEDFYTWSFTGETVYLSDRETVQTELLYNVPCHMEKIDGLWIITN